ncbi:MAG: hypothetical protein II949_08320 [Prevotella sp.]|nr:hypothetical protein [Prevotella sp.]
MTKSTTLMTRAAMTLFMAFITSTTATAGDGIIDITFAGRGSATNVESVTVNNLSNPDLTPVTFSGSATLRLVDKAAAMRKGDVNADSQVGIGDIVAITNVMAGAEADETTRTRSDVNGDGDVGIGDIVAITNLMAGNFSIGGATGNVVTMDFHEGDIIRFEGKSGEMRTIVVNAPERSHSIPFYFYPCKDVSGNTYPIIEAGGLLWMAEDLHALRNVQLVSFYTPARASGWTSAVQNKESTAMAMVINDNDVYYTLAAARQALPEGWELPTLNELNAVAINLGGYDVVGGKMKRAGDDESFSDALFLQPDSLQLRISPKGYIGEDGQIADANSGYILTGTRYDHKGVYMKISSGTTEGTIKHLENGKSVPNGLSAYGAVHIRGVRPAPSAYTDMINQLYGTTHNGAQMKAPRWAEGAQIDEENPFTGEVNPYTGTPYGQYYTVDYSTKQIVMDVMGQKCMGWDDTFAPDQAYQGTVFVNATDGSITQKQADGNWINDNSGNRMNRTRLKKLCPQKVADGTYNTLKVSYDATVRDYQNDGSTNGRWMARDLEAREGRLILEVFGNADSNFALLKSITLPDIYTMAEFDGFKENDTRWTEELRLNEFYMKRLNLLAGDFNQDGVDDVVVGFCSQWTVLDGTDYTTVLAQRTFPTDCVRACVGDLDENGFTDLGIIYQHNDQLHVRVILDDINKFDDTENRNLDEVADYIGTLPVEKAGVSSFLDIKFGDITNTGNSVLCLAVSNRHINLNPKSVFYILQRGSNNLLKQVFRFEEEQKIELSNMSSDRTSTNTNSTIAVVHTQGLGQRPDVLLHNGLYRLNDSNEFEMVNIGGYKDEGKLIDAAIHSDNVAVGRFTDDLPEGYEQLAYFGTRVAGFVSSDWNSSAGDWHRRGIYGVVELLTPDTISATMMRKELHSGVTGSHCNWTKDGDFHFGANFPAFCATSYTNIDTRRYKFVSCQATMSEPRIKFALAAAPYWAKVPPGYAHAGEDYDYGDNGPSTEWTTWTSSTTGKENSNSTSASFIFGFEHEDEASIFGFEFAKAGVDFEASLNYEWEKSVAHTDTWTFESGCSASRDNKVGLTMTPYWLYTYKCIDSNDPDNIGTTIVCGAPSYPRDLELSVTDYMLLRGDRDDIPDVSTIFTHTPGNPLTYLSNPDLVQSTGGIIWSNNDKNKFTTTGSDGTKSYSIEVSKETASTTQNTFGFDTKLVAFAGGANTVVKAGFGAGYSHTWSTIYNTGEGTVVTGTVPLPKSWGDVPIFDWNMYRHVVKVGGQEFPVVNYIVKNVRKAN